MKIGVVDVGGGLRDIYAVGVLDYCMDQNIRFDLGIGVSAGSANLASYCAGQRGRNYQFYTEYAFRKEYMGLGNFLTTKSFINMDYVFSTLCNQGGENPLDYPALRDNPMELYVVATNALTGDTRYFDKQDIRQDDYNIMKASASIPFICQPYPVKGIPYFDGALGDPVPVEKAFRLGCDRVVVILSRPEDALRTPEKDQRYAAGIQRKYPAAAAKLCRRAQTYNAEVSLAREYAKQGKVLIVAPDDICGMNTLKRDRDALHRLYEKGYADGKKIKSFLESVR